METNRIKALELVKEIKRAVENENSFDLQLEVKSKLVETKKTSRIELRFYLVNYNIWDYWDLKRISNILNRFNINDGLHIGYLCVDNENRIYFTYDIWIKEGE